MTGPNHRGPDRRGQRQTPPSPEKALATADGIDRRVASLLRQLSAMESGQIAAIAEPVLAHLAAAVAGIHRVHAGFCDWATDQPQPHFMPDANADQLPEPEASGGQATHASATAHRQPATRPHHALPAQAWPSARLGFVSPMYGAALLRSIRLQTALLRYRARTVAIAAVRRGWWDEHTASGALTDAGLTALPMLWPVQVDLPAQMTVAAASPDDAFGLASLRISALLDRALGQNAVWPLVSSVSSTKRPPIDDSGRPAFRIRMSVRVEMTVAATGAGDAVQQLRDMVESRLADRLRVFDCPQARYRVAEDSSVDGLEPVDPDPQADRPSDTELHQLLAGDITADGSAVADAVSALAALTRSLRRSVIDRIGANLARHGDVYLHADLVLTAMDLAPLPRSWQYHITAQAAVIVAAASSDEAETLARQQFARDTPASDVLRSLAVAVDRVNVVTEVHDDQRYAVTFHLIFLVCHRHSSNVDLAQAAVRLALPAAGDIWSISELRTQPLGHRIDRFLDGQHD